MRTLANNSGKLVHAGRERTYQVHLPPQYDGKKKFPIVLSLHGGGGNAVIHRRQTQMDFAADKYGYIAVYPEGTGSVPGMLTWNAGACCGYARDNDVDDVGFIGALMNVLAKQPAADMSRVYVCGMSNGSSMALRVAVELSTRIAAVCGVAATLGVDGPSDEGRLDVPMIAIHGLLDRNAPVLGGVGESAISKVEHRSAWDVCYEWGEANSCNCSRLVEATAECLRFEWKSKHPVALCLLPNGGHQWPGGVDVTKTPDDGPVSPFDANAAIWEFFRQFKR